MPPKSKKVQEIMVSPKSGSPKNKTKRCPKGETRNPKTGVCEKKAEKPEKNIEQSFEKQPKKIEMREKPKNLSKMTIKDQKIFEKRKECISAYRKKLPSLIEEFKESQENLSEKSPEKSPKSPEKSPKSPEKSPKKLTLKSKKLSAENTNTASSKMQILQFHSKSKLLPKTSPLPPTAMRDLSNFSKHHVEYERKVYPTVEHAFQAQKGTCLVDKKGEPISEDKKEEFIEKVRALETPEQAKSAGGKGTMKKEGISLDIKCWDSKRNDIMVALIRSKVDRHEDIRNILDIVKKENIRLVHFSRMDMEWGAHVDPETNEITGKNRLGELYMSLL